MGTLESTYFFVIEKIGKDVKIRSLVENVDDIKFWHKSTASTCF